jgi:hypothetical protein
VSRPYNWSESLLKKELAPNRKSTTTTQMQCNLRNLVQLQTHIYQGYNSFGSTDSSCNTGNMQVVYLVHINNHKKSDSFQTDQHIISLVSCRKGCFFIKLIKLNTFVLECMDHSDCIAYSSMNVPTSNAKRP